ncbi:MAG TPA: hypothetical protein VF644_17940 [Pyrinomonadaceae bacterium]
MEKAQELNDKLLANMKENQTEIENLDNAFKSLEQDYVYRFYHQSFKVFGAASQIKQAKELFERLAPDSCPLNNSLNAIADNANGKESDVARTNQFRQAETRPKRSIQALEIFSRTNASFRARIGKKPKHFTRRMGGGFISLQSAIITAKIFLSVLYLPTSSVAHWLLNIFSASELISA